MKNLYFTTFLLVIFLASSFSFAREKSTRLTDEFINTIERTLQQSIDVESLNETQKYNLYANAARELMSYGHYKHSLKYYELSLISALDKGMEEAFYNKLFLKYQLKKDPDELFEALEEFERYSEQSNTIKKYSYAISSWKLMLSKDTDAEITPQNSLFAPEVTQNDMETLVKDKKFSQALQLLPKHLSHANINFQIESDILKTIIFGRTQELYCDKKLQKYPNSFAYTMVICKYLKGDESISLSFVESRVKKHSPKRLFWIDAMREIK